MLLLLIILALPVSIGAALYLRTSCDSRDGSRCTYCGYPVGGLIDPSICPECGEDPRFDHRVRVRLRAAAYWAFVTPTVVAVGGSAVVMPSIAPYAIVLWPLATLPAVVCLRTVDAALSRAGAILVAALLLGPLLLASIGAVISSGMYRLGYLPSNAEYGLGVDIILSMLGGVIIGGGGSLWLFAIAAVVITVQRSRSAA